MEFQKKIRVSREQPIVRDIWSNTGSANLIGYATIIMQIDGRLAAANRAELKFRPRLRHEGNERRAVACILMLLHAAPSI